MMQVGVQTLLMVVYLGSFSHSMKDNYGTEFIVPVTGAKRLARLGALEIISDRSKTFVTYEFERIKKTIPIPRKYKRLPLKSLMMRMKSSSSQTRKGVYISSTAPIAVYKVWGFHRYMCIPIAALSTHYTVANVLPSFKCKAFILVTAIESNTKVTIKFQPTEKRKCFKTVVGKEQKVVINRLDVYEIACEFDMTGSRVISNKPTAVVSGIDCFIAHFELMMIPNEVLGVSFVLPPIKDMPSVYRIVATVKNTKLDTNDGRSWKVGSKMHLDIPMSSGKAVCIKASNPVQVLSVFHPKHHSPRRKGFEKLAKLFGGRRPNHIGGKITMVIVNYVPSTGHFLQKYSLHDEGLHESSRKRTMKYAITAVVQKDVAHILVESLKKHGETKITQHPIHSCEFVLVTTPLTFKGLVTFKSHVPFGLLLHELGPRVNFAIVPGFLFDITDCPTDTGYLYLAKYDWCMRLEKRQYPRRLAGKMCHISGGHLVDITSEKKNRVVKAIYGKGNDTQQVYTGGLRHPFYQNRTRVWLWSDCSPLRHGNWHKSKHLWTCMILEGRDMKWTQSDCHRNASSICEVDVHHVSFQRNHKLGPVKRRKKCRGKRYRHYSRHHRRTGGASTVTTDYQSVTKSLSTTSPHPARSDFAESQYFFPTTHGKQANTFANNSPVHQDEVTTSTKTSAPEAEYEEYEIGVDYDEAEEQMDGNKRKITPSTSEERVKTSRTPEQKSSVNNQTTAPSKTPLSHVMSVNSSIATTFKPIVRTLNMTLVLEIYLKHTENAKSVLAARERILNRAKKIRQKCHCFCKCNRLQNTTQAAIQEHKEKVKKKLGVEKSSLRKTWSKKISAQDKRTSAAVVGCIGFLFLLLPFAVIVLSDVSALLIRHRAQGEKVLEKN